MRICWFLKMGLVKVHRGLAVRSTSAALLCFLLYFPVLPTCAQVKVPKTIAITFPKFSYTYPARSLSELDLKNSEVIMFGEKGRPDFRGRLRRGAYEESGRDRIESVRFGWLTLIATDSADQGYAVAYYTWVASAGSTTDLGVVHLLHIDDAHLKVVQQIVFNTRGSKRAGAFFNTRSGVLTIRGLNEWEHCCPSGLDVVQFQLRDGSLAPIHYFKAPLK